MNSKKMKIKHLLLFFIIILSSNLFLQAQGTVTILGKATEYSGHEIKFYRYADIISEERELVTTLKIDATGNFRSTFELDQVSYTFASFDTYKGSIFLTPGETYELVLPPLKKISESQKRNPFFQYDEIAFAIKNSQPADLNRQIQHFEMAYLKEESKYFNQIFQQHSKSAVDSLNAHLAKRFPKSQNEYFEQYKFYRTGFAEYALNQGQSSDFIKTYFVDHQPNLLIPPCGQLFKQLFSDYFSFESNQIHGNDFKKIVAQGNLSGIQDYFIINNEWDKNLSRLVILQALKDGYYQGDFSPKTILLLLDKIVHSQWGNDKKAVAERIKKRLTYLSEGSPAPNFLMKDLSDKSFELSDFKGKYSYLNFTRVANPICRQHLDQMKKTDPNLLNELQILNLILPEEASQKELIREQDWTGEFYVVSNEVADQYQLTNFPKAFLLDKQGRFVMSPAPNPLDGFEQQFMNLLKQKRLEELRNQPK